MKKTITLLTITLAFFGMKLHAQDEDCSVCGWYVDGVKADSIDCYSFDKLTLVLEYNEGMAGYDKLYISVDEEATVSQGFMSSSSLGAGVLSVQGTAIKTYVKNGYVVYTVFAKSYGQGTNMSMQAEGYYANAGATLSRYGLQYEAKKMKTKGGDPGADAMLYGYIDAGTITGYTETYDAGCQCSKRDPQITYTRLSKVYPLKLKKRIVDVYMATGKVDMTVPCSVPGKKVDLNNLGNSSGSSTSTNSSATTNSAGTTKSSASASTPSPSANGTTPYSEKYDNGKISVQGQKNKDDNQEGTWKYFDENGKLDRIENYKNGIADGEWKYYEEGKLTKTEVYKDGELISTKEVE